MSESVSQEVGAFGVSNANAGIGDLSDPEASGSGGGDDVTPEAAPTPAPSIFSGLANLDLDSIATNLAGKAINIAIGLSPPGAMLNAITTGVNLAAKAFGYEGSQVSLGSMAIEAGKAVARGDITPSSATAQQDAGNAATGNSRGDSPVLASADEFGFSNSIFMGGVLQSSPQSSPQSSQQNQNDAQAPVISVPSPAGKGSNPYAPLLPTFGTVGALWL